MKTTTTTFTSTISPELIEWVDSIAKEKKRTRRAVLEEALSRYRHELTARRLEADFKSVAGDQDIIDMAEWGVADYDQMLKNFDA